MAPSPRKRALPPSAPSKETTNAPPLPIAMDIAQQKLVWPPLKGGDKNDERQVDIVQVTRLHSTPVDISHISGICLIENGIRFDPDEYPDISRKTQERLATKIIESGISPALGKTIKVKEYSSKTRKRIRFACSREDCSVTFQINFDSKKGHWFMKRNKGNFVHSCSAVQGACLSEHNDASFGESSEPMTQVASAQTASSAPIAAQESESEAAAIERPDVEESNYQSLKRCSPELRPDDDSAVCHKRSRVHTQTAKLRASSRIRRDPSKSADVKERPSGSPTSNEGEHTENSSRAETPTIKNGSARSKRVRKVRHYEYYTAPMSREGYVTRRSRRYYTRVPSTAAVDKTGKTEITSTDGDKTQLEPSPNSVTISIYSHDAPYKDDRYHEGITTSRRTERPFHSSAVYHAYEPPISPVMAASVPPRVVSSHPHSYASEELYYPAVVPHMTETNFSAQNFFEESDQHFHADSRPDDGGAGNAPHESALSPASVDAEGFDDIAFAVPDNVARASPPHGASSYPQHHNHTSYEQTRAGASVASSSRVELKICGDMENISQKMSFCSLLVSPLDMTHENLWARHLSGDQEGDDNSSISTNWSAMDFKA